VGQINETLRKVLYHNLCVLVQAMQELGVEEAFSEGLGFCNRENLYTFRDALCKFWWPRVPYEKLIVE
jgi:hypothetical protein